MGSPKQWGYRTKITPHFDAVPKWARAGIEAKSEIVLGEEAALNQIETVIGEGPGGRKWECKIGFDRKGRPGVLDIEVGEIPLV